MRARLRAAMSASSCASRTSQYASVAVTIAACRAFSVWSRAPAIAFLGGVDPRADLAPGEHRLRDRRLAVQDVLLGREEPAEQGLLALVALAGERAVERDVGHRRRPLLDVLAVHPGLVLAGALHVAIALGDQADRLVQGEPQRVAAPPAHWARAAGRQPAPTAPAGRQRQGADLRRRPGAAAPRRPRRAPRLRRAAQVVQQRVDHRHDDQGQQRRGDQAADHRAAHRRAHLGARADGQRRRQHAEDHRQGGHHDRAQAGAAGLDQRLAPRPCPRSRSVLV